MELTEQLFVNRSIFGLEFDGSNNPKHITVVSPEHQAFYFSKNEYLDKKFMFLITTILISQRKFIFLFLFFSLARPVTKNQILNTKCQPKFLLSFQFQKRRD